MACNLFFGLPGCGKTTLMTHFALMALKTGRYENVYGNVRLLIDGYVFIDNDCIGQYLLRDCLLLIDEATLFADSRAYKEFTRGKMTYFLEHRHYRADIFLFTQQWDGIDRKIRTITDRVYYVYKGFFTGRWISKYYRIPYGIQFPDPSSEKYGEIVQGYRKPDLFTQIFCPVLIRPLYYKYFDSFECPPLPELPPEYVAYNSREGVVFFSPKYTDQLDVLYEFMESKISNCLSDLQLRQEFVLQNAFKLYQRNLVPILEN